MTNHQYMYVLEKPQEVYLERQPSALQTFKLRCRMFDLQPRHYVIHIARPGAAAANTT
eukprot:COSAG01_NODE_50928_length_359_cov_0.600000_1_plen_57_part_10